MEPKYLCQESWQLWLQSAKNIKIMVKLHGVKGHEDKWVL